MHDTQQARRRSGTVAQVVGLEFGCDYNPEQWTPDVWAEDVRLMREAGVTLVAINVFGWATVEPREGEYDFSMLDAVMTLLHDNGIGVNLGTGTASPPAWFSRTHPESLPMLADGTRRHFGGRQAYCPSSAPFRVASLALVRATAERYGHHPGLALWHVSNELGCHNALCYCDESSASFRRWLEVRYLDIGTLNAAWGTAFWSQRYGSFDEIEAPKLTVSTRNPAQMLDFQRFSSDETLSQHLAEAAVLRSLSSVPVTTNFMVTAHIQNQDYFQWAPHVDIVANDHYLDHRLADPIAELAFSADLTRGIAGGRPWLLMESATGAVNWQPRNIAKVPGEMTRHSLTQLARGADGICFFQWRASLQGSEQFHSAMLPHAGTDTDTWREVVELGALLGRLRDITESTVVADVALLFSWPARWALDSESKPSSDVTYLDQVHRAYAALRELGVTVDIIDPDADLTNYPLVVAPALYLVTDVQVRAIEHYVRSGGHLVTTFLSGIVDESDRVRPGGYPGAFRELLGVSTEQFFPLAEAEVVTLTEGWTASVWTEKTRALTARVESRFTSGMLAGHPAITRSEYGAGVARYVGTHLDPEALSAVMRTATLEAGVDIDAAHLPGVDVVVRRSAEHDYTFVINHRSTDVDHAASGDELVTDAPATGIVRVPAGSVRIIRTPLLRTPPAAGPDTPSA